MAIIPMKNARISQEYGRISTKYKKGYHTGLDLVADGTDKGVYNISPGAILRARFSPGSKGADPTGWGNYITVRQDDGHDVLYAHLAQIAVTQGQRVAPGDKLGLQGSTGNSTGPHLHFGVWAGSWEQRNDINAADYLGIKNQVGPTTYADMYEEDRLWAMEQGITDGSNPDHTITRKEVWAMLRRASK